MQEKVLNTLWVFALGEREKIQKRLVCSSLDVNKTTLLTSYSLVGSSLELSLAQGQSILLKLRSNNKYVI